MLNDLLASLKLLARKGKKFSYLIYKTTGFIPKNPDYYILAFQHKSLMKRDFNGHPLNNERLEYLGDAVLSAIIAHELFLRFPNKNEGVLTKIRSRIVSRINLNQLAYKIGLQKFIQTQPISDLSQTHIPGDALEALIGAIYLDKGYEKTRKFIQNKIIAQYSKLDELVKKDTNYKSLFIEWGQKNKCEIHFVTEEYPNHSTKELTFIARACINNQVAGQGTGASKKEAQQNAALKALKYAKSINLNPYLAI